MTTQSISELAASGYQTLASKIERAMAYAPADVFAELRDVKTDALKMRDLLLADTRAVTGLEYGIIAGVLGLVLIAIFHGFAGHLSTLFSTVGGKI